MQPTLAPAPPPPSSLHHHQQPQDMNAADNALRASLAAHIDPNSHHAGPPAHGYGDPSSHLAPASPYDDRHNIDPDISHHADMMSGSADSGGDDSTNDGRKGGKRELSQSKRAAQNRAAQRAFRQRKEGYIKKLEEQVRELHALEDNYKAIQTENYSLREYIIHLQSRLIESHGEYPQPPANVNLSHPQQPDASDLRGLVGAAGRSGVAAGGRPQQQQQQQHMNEGIAPAAPMGMSHINALQANATQAMADLKRRPERMGAADPNEELTRQLQASAEGLPA